MPIARVALDCPVYSLFDYRVTDQEIRKGHLVVVSFRKRRKVGLVLEVVKESQIDEARLRYVESILPVEPLPETTLALIQFSSAYYQCPVGLAAFATLPAAVKNVRYVAPKPRWQYALTSVGMEVRPDQFRTRATLQRQLCQSLHEKRVLRASDLRGLSSQATKLAELWVKKGWIEKTPDNGAGISEFWLKDELALTEEQRAAVEKISSTLGSFSPWLLEGVTGSGKTEVYFRLIEQVTRCNLQTLLLVPEINLTPQLEERFRSRFPGLRLVGLHSDLGQIERCANWLAARAGEAQVVIGTRLAVFTPLPRLGLIIVDEEQDGSFKQQDGLRYSARDLAVFCARQRQVPVVLGSATPSLETFHNARGGRFGYLQLSRRPVAATPRVRLVDVRGMPKGHRFDEQVTKAIGACLVRGEQCLVFLNRRGFAPALVCGACGWNAECGRCSAHLVWHVQDAALRCHYCGYQQQLPAACPSCGNQDLKGLGEGTQRLERRLEELYPDAHILRIDRDSTRRKHAWQQMQADIRTELVDILVGTQMLAKGHDFPRLTLVVIVNPDAALFAADFRASEKLLQQLMQVSGRAGRANLPGEVLVQTQFPGHPLYQALVRQDYQSYAEELLAERKRAEFPPFVYQALLRAESHSKSALVDFLDHASRHATSNQCVTLFDPVPATIAKIAGQHRGQLLAQSFARAELQRFLPEWRLHLATPEANRVRWSIDVDPVEL